MQVPHILQQHGPRDHLSGVAGQVFKELEFTRQQLNVLPVSAGDACQQIDFQISNPDHRLFDQRCTAARKRIDPSQHLSRSKGFYQVIVTARSQASYAIVNLAEGAEDQRRSGDPLLSGAPYHFKAIDPRQQTVNSHHQLPGANRPVKSLFPIRCHINGIAVMSETLRQLFGRLAIILNYENPPFTARHRQIPTDGEQYWLATIRTVPGKVTFMSEN